MSSEKTYIRHGFGAVRPYIFGHNDLPEFVKQTFNAVELARYPMGEDSFLVESMIGDSIVVIDTFEDLPPVPPTPTPAWIYVYVEDVDETYKRALECGATSVEEPVDKHYEERAAGVRDTFGNTWWISTYKKAHPERQQ
jgi:PhnB protein